MRVLLHICCAVCAGSCLETLRREGHEVGGYFYNPNIQPQEEYLKRLQEAEKLARQENFSLIIGEDEPDKWFSRIKGLEEEPEGGRRCARCFSLRLEKTAKVAQEKGFAAFTTTLTVSPHKNARVINEIGRDVGGGLFLGRDFKKKDGFKRAQQLARRYNLYHQDYCGCIYSD
ncbi:MAG: epoxyqueuosine reductase QueH [Candidatus Omnitrophica bacterium]|nr:epoxyqueuosine reductase QueH [Candidatus Omnitrophota bacterium]